MKPMSMQFTTNRCSETRTVCGKSYRCEGLANHDSVHFHGEVGWWPRETRINWKAYAFWVVTALVVLGVMIWLVYL